MRAAAIALLATICLAGHARGHGSPYVVFACRFLDAVDRPVSGLTVALELRPERAGDPAIRAEAPIRQGLARVTVAFPGDFQGTIRMRVMDAKRRPVARAGASGEVTLVFTYAHRAGTGLEAAFAARAPAGDPLKDGEAGLGADGRVCERPEAAIAFRLDWSPGREDSAEAAEAASGRAVDRGIAADFQARLAEIRKKRERR